MISCCVTGPYCMGDHNFSNCPDEGEGIQVWASDGAPPRQSAAANKCGSTSAWAD